MTPCSSVKDLRAKVGGMEGGGGKVVVCHSAQQSSASVELLDLWESRVLYNGLVSQDLAHADVSTGVKLVISKLKNSFPFNGTMSNQTGPLCASQDCVEYFLNQISQLFLTSDPTVIRLRGVKLALTNDSYEIALPRSCEIQQVINYQPGGRIYIDQDLYEKLDVLNQIALIVHESYYDMLREFAAEQSSVRTRRAVGYAMSMKDFPFTPSKIPKKFLECTSEKIDGVRTQTSLSFYPSYNQNGQKSGVTMFVNQFGATPLIGIGSSEFQLLGNSFDFILNRKCNGSGQIMVHGTDWFKGPVEFDKTLLVNWICENGVPTPYVNENRAGSNVGTTKLSCSMISK